MIFIETKDEVLGLAHTILDSPDMLYADIETTGLDFFIDKILLFQLKHKDIIYIIDVRKVGYETLTTFVKWLRGLTFVFHNAKFDLKFIYHRTGILLENVYDTMVAEVVLNSGIGKTLYSLEELAEKYADTFMDKTTRKEFINFPDDAPFTERQLNYSALDVQVLEPIYNNQLEQFAKTNQTRVMIVENELIPIVAKMEYDGIRIKQDEWLKIEQEAIALRDKLTEEFNKEIIDFILTLKCKNGLELAEKIHIPVNTKRLKKTLEEITDLSNMRTWLEEHFNVKSPNQLLSVFHLMGIKCKNTNEKTLNDFKKYPIVDKLVEIRGINKQIDQYGSNFLKSISPYSGKIHTEYFTVGTQTGRFSSNNPNLQNIPVHGGYRECFIPEEDYLFAGVDYSQQEYRLAGAVSNEPVIIKAYKSGSDMHTATGKIVAKKDVITKDERHIGKTVNFAILYGSTEWGLKKNLRINIEEAIAIIKAFWEGYPNLAKFMDMAGKKILELGYSRTPLGRIRYNIPKPVYGNSRDFINWQERVLREGRNHIIQGGGADILKIAIIEVYKKNPFGDKLKLTLQIHDELVCQVHKSIANDGLEFIKNVMIDVEQRFLKDIPAAVEGELKEQWSK